MKSLLDRRADALLEAQEAILKCLDAFAEGEKDDYMLDGVKVKLINLIAGVTADRSKQ